MKFFALATTSIVAALAAGSLANPVAEPIAAPVADAAAAAQTDGPLRTDVLLFNNAQCANALIGVSRCGTRYAMPYDGLRWVNVNYGGGRAASFWSRSDCTGESVVVGTTAQCRAFDFDVKCVLIAC